MSQIPVTILYQGVSKLIPNPDHIRVKKKPYLSKNGKKKKFSVANNFEVKGPSKKKRIEETDENFHLKKNRNLSCSSSSHSKRDTGDLSPAHSQMKKKAKVKKEDGIPLPKSSTLLDFIPLPKTTPILPLDFIPLPKSPTPEKDEDLPHFFVLDTEPSIVTIDIPKPGKSSSKEVKHEDDIGIICEDQDKKHMCDLSVSSNTSLRSARESQGLLNPGRSVIADQQTRNCHSYTQGLKAKEKNIETVDDLEDIEIIERPIVRTPTLTIEEIARNIKSKKNRLTQKNSNVHSFGVDASCSEDEKTNKKASPDIKEVDAFDSDVVPYSPEQQTFTIFNVDSSPEIQSVDVSDPDVLEVEDSNSSMFKFEFDLALDSDSSDVGSDHEVVDMELGEDQSVTNRDFVALDSTVCVKDLENTKIDLSDEVLDMRKELENIRQWEMTGLGQEVLIDQSGVRHMDVVFTLLSYNVLAQKLLTDNMYLYEQCYQENLSWDYRWSLLQHEISQIDPDVLTLQEVQASHWNSHYKPWMLHKGYDAVYKKRTGGKCDGVAIFFKKDKFSLVEYTPIEYLQPRSGGLLDRDNVGIIAKLQSLESPNSSPVCFGTTHLLYNPRRHDIKLCQIVLFLTELDRLCYRGDKFGKTHYCPAIITGDFNAEPHSAVAEFVRNGRMAYEGLNNRTLTRYGFKKGSLLGPQLLPPALGITDRCQHSVLAQSRFLEGKQGPMMSVKDKRKLEESLIRISQSNNDNTEQFNGNLWEGPIHSGWFSHDFNFNSVYRHKVRRLRNAPEATTYHNNWTTVDYIMYNRVYSANKGRPVEGNLKLLARYGLLAGTEAHRFSPLPSAVCPSDHFPLAAQFLL
ncbi:unnamed protein product, partial [Meganyctiphanes norvegica]